MVRMLRTALRFHGSGLGETTSVPRHTTASITECRPATIHKAADGVRTHASMFLLQATLAPTSSEEMRKLAETAINSASFALGCCTSHELHNREQCETSSSERHQRLPVDGAEREAAQMLTKTSRRSGWVLPRQQRELERRRTRFVRKVLRSSQLARSKTGATASDTVSSGAAWITASAATTKPHRWCGVQRTTQRILKGEDCERKCEVAAKWY